MRAPLPFIRQNIQGSKNSWNRRNTVVTLNFGKSYSQITVVAMKVYEVLYDNFEDNKSVCKLRCSRFEGWGRLYPMVKGTIAKCLRLHCNCYSFIPIYEPLRTTEKNTVKPLVWKCSCARRNKRENLERNLTESGDEAQTHHVLCNSTVRSALLVTHAGAICHRAIYIPTAPMFSFYHCYHATLYRDQRGFRGPIIDWWKDHSFEIAF